MPTRYNRGSDSFHSMFGGQDDPSTIQILTPNQQLAISGFVTRTYGWMFVGLALTGLVSYLVVSTPTLLETVQSNPFILFGAIIAELITVLALSMLANRISATAATAGFLVYAGLNGITFSLIFLIYTAASVAQVFMITAGMFGGLAVFGAVTKKNLTGMGSFMMMGLWGLILVGIVNVFLQSNALSMSLSVVSVLVFAGLTAWDAQKIKAMAYQYSLEQGGLGRGEADKGAIFGALALYLDFINLFVALLRLFGTRRE